MTLKPASPVIAYLFTTFPKATETFLQREIIAMKAHGVQLRLYSLWGGVDTFRGLPVRRFPKWKLLTLLWMIPYESWRRPEVLKEVLHGLCTRRAPSWLNFWENMLGAGFACLYAGSFRKHPPAHVHAAWGGAPATAALRSHRGLKNARSLGLIGAADLRAGGGAYGSGVSRRLRAEAATRGVLLRPLGDVLYAVPPYCVTDEELATIWRVLAEIAAP